MRRESPLGPARHDHRDAVRYVRSINTEQRRQRRRKRVHRESAGEIIDAAIAFGFGEDRDNLGGQQLAVIDQPQDPADIGGMAHWQAMDKALHWGPPLRPRKVNQALWQMLKQLVIALRGLFRGRQYRSGQNSVRVSRKVGLV